MHVVGVNNAKLCRVKSPATCQKRGTPKGSDLTIIGLQQSETEETTYIQENLLALVDFTPQKKKKG